MTSGVPPMRRAVEVPHPRGVRFEVELSRDEAGRVTGAVTPEGQDPARFSGWLDLLRLLECGVEPTGAPPPG